MGRPAHLSEADVVAVLGVADGRELCPVTAFVCDVGVGWEGAGSDFDVLGAFADKPNWRGAPSARLWIARWWGLSSLICACTSGTSGAGCRGWIGGLKSKAPHFVLPRASVSFAPTDLYQSNFPSLGCQRLPPTPARTPVVVVNVPPELNGLVRLV